MPSIFPKVFSILRVFLPLRPSGSSDMKIMMSSASDLVSLKQDSGLVLRKIANESWNLSKPTQTMIAL